jgi:hypothetical protein
MPDGTLRSGGTMSMRSALMPTSMTSRAFMGYLGLISVRHSGARVKRANPE